MSLLTVSFGPLELRNPVVMASAPPTETVDNIARGADAGAAAAITKTIASFDAQTFPLGGRRTYLDKRGLWALSTFRRETLTVEAGVELVAGSVQRTDIPIIASVGALTMDPESWLPTCLALQEAGAHAIQLDLFYLPQPRCSPASTRGLTDLLAFLAARLRVPLMPKLNIDLPAHYAAEVLRDAPVAGLFAIDSIRVPTPIDVKRGFSLPMTGIANAAECSLFGAWQKPITLQYTRTLAEHQPLPICAGGGLMTGLDAVEAIALGATAVQFATAIIQRGFPWIGKVLNELERYMHENNYADVASMRGAAIKQLEVDERKIVFDDIKATVNHDLCIMCGLCTRQVFCSDIHVVNDRIEVLESCDGCGLCVAMCPTSPKALSLVSASDWKRKESK